MLDRTARRLLPALALTLAFAAELTAQTQPTRNPITQPGNATSIYQIGGLLVEAKPPASTPPGSLYPTHFRYHVYRLFVEPGVPDQEAAGVFSYRCNDSSSMSNSTDYRTPDGQPIMNIEEVDSTFRAWMEVLYSTGSMYAHGCGRTAEASNLTSEAAGDPRALTQDIRAGEFELLPRSGPFSKADVVTAVICWQKSGMLAEEDELSAATRDWARKLSDMFSFVFVGQAFQFGEDISDDLEEIEVEYSDETFANATKELNACWNDLNRLLDKM